MTRRSIPDKLSPSGTSSGRLVVTVSGLQVKGFHGVFVEEKTQGVNLLVDVRATLSETPDKDKLEQTVDYVWLCERFLRLSADYSRDLLETLAHEYTSAVMAERPEVDQIWVAIRKISAKVGFKVDSLGVEHDRQRN